MNFFTTKFNNTLHVRNNDSSVAISDFEMNAYYEIWNETQ